MKIKKLYGLRIVQYILSVLMILSFLFLILGEIVMPVENNWEETTFQMFEPEWVQILPNGDEVPVTVPGECTAKHGEWVTIATVLSQEQKDTSICIRSMQQDIRIYVGDELRKEYSTLETQPFGKTSTMTYVFFQLYEGDAGAQLRIEFMSDSAYSGYVHEMYMGDRSDIVHHFYGVYAPSAIVAALMVLVGLFVVCGSLFIFVVYKRKVELIHLGNGILIAATWLLVESKFRQFIFPNSTIAMLMGFLLIAILPYPFLSYINSIQGYRYQKVYYVLGIATAVNYVVVVALQVLNIKDFFETMTSSHIIIILLILTMGTTIVTDVIKGHVKAYREAAIGFAGIMVAGVFEITLTYTVNAQINGIALCIGLVLWLVSAGLKTVRDLYNIEKEKQIAIAASQSKAQFLANMSHEIRTPINTVIGMNEMILRENKDETIEEYAYNIKSASRMLLGLINDVLDFSKIEAGKLRLVNNDYYLANMLNDVILGIEVRVKQKNLELKLDIDEKLPSVLLGDEIRIKQILNNLLSNAIKYTEKGSVTLRAKGAYSEDGFGLILEVEDTGVGIKKADMDRLFDSFERLELEKNRYIEGTGLGLNITKELVSIMNGRISVRSEYGSGSCFTVTIPQQIVNAEAMGQLEQKRRHSQEDIASKEKYLCIPDSRILVVDDTKMNLVVIKALLKRNQAQLDTASGGNECLEKTKEQKYDLILMDHMMPEPDGVQTMHMIRADGENLNRETPIVVLTANAIEGMKEQYLKDGFSDYLAKPVEAEDLENILSKFLAVEK